MNRYTVVWVPTAETKLANLWLYAGEPVAIQAASDFIDTVLATHPHSLGMEISAGLRAATVGRLQVLYRVYSLDRLVKVLAVRLAT
jgi:hypothetical protein